VNEVARCLEEEHCRFACRSRHGPDHGYRFPSVPWRRLPLCGPDGRGNYVALCEKYAHLGKAYEAPQLLKDMAAANKKFFG
jgi:3-hydroxyacyl-CoA dehydrogenase/enoyl-CoA hydratase/3-hydroxybutyryl-CoA epimerase/enoyl-CoA isomerase